eukprot:COSAG03_NODE_4842_length_1414_cov_1.399240_1_plen_354_part_10
MPSARGSGGAPPSSARSERASLSRGPLQSHTSPVAYRVLVKKVAVRRDVSLRSAKVSSLVQDQVVDCVEQREEGGRLRCRVFLGGREGYGWISAIASDGTTLIERHVADGAASPGIGTEGATAGSGASAIGAESATAGSGAAGSSFGAAVRWRQATRSELAYAFDALYHGTRMMRRRRRLRVTFDAWTDLRLGRATTGSFSARAAAHMEQQLQARPRPEPNTGAVVPGLTLQPLSISSVGPPAGPQTNSQGMPLDPPSELFPGGLPPMQGARSEIAPGSPEAQAALQQEVAWLRQSNDALHQDLVRLQHERQLEEDAMRAAMAELEQRHQAMLAENAAEQVRGEAGAETALLLE